MLRSLARYPSGRPGCAVLTTVNGETFTSDWLISTNARRITNVFQTPAGSTISMEINEHGLTTGQTINARIGGWHGLTKAAHPGNGQWVVTVVDDSTVILDGSTYVANSIFLHGMAYTGSLIDARPAITELQNLATARGGGVIELPAGVIAFLTKEGGNTGLTLQPFVVMAGREKDTTTIFYGDGYNAFGMQSIGTSDITLRDFTVMGNRQYQGPAGYHILRFGSTDPENVTRNVRILGLAILGAAGYGIGWQSDGAYQDCLIDDLTINECDSDGMDFKDRAFADKNNTLSNVWVYNFGLYKIGVDYDPVALASNPFTTTSGLSVVTVANIGHEYQVGMTATFAGAATFNGVNPNTTGTILSVATDTYTIDLGQIASGSSSGGGSACEEYVAQFSSGDAGLDFRGVMWNANNIHVEGDIQSRTGVRARLGDISTDNGFGPHRSNISNVTVLNTGNIANSQGVYLGCLDANYFGVTVKGCSFGAFVAATAERCNINGLHTDGCNYGAWVDGDDCYIEGSANESLVCSFYVFGGLLPDGTTHFATNNRISGRSKDSAKGFWADTRATGTIFDEGCTSDGDTIRRQDNGVGTIWNSPQLFSARRIVSAPTAGTTNPTILTEADSQKNFYVPSNATEQGVFTLPAPSTSLVGMEVTVCSLHATLGAKINANGAGVRILAVSAASSSSVSTTTQGASVTLRLVTTSLWLATASIGTWATP